MFDEVRRNPVFNRLTDPDRILTVVTAVTAAVLFTVLCTLSTFVLTFLSLYGSPTDTISFAVAAISLAVFLLSPFLSWILTLIGTRRNPLIDTQSLLLITGLSNERIVQGYLYAAIYRLRWVWVMSVILPLPLWLTLTKYRMFLNCARFGPNCSPGMREIIWAGYIVISTILLWYMMNRLAIHLALYTALSYNGVLAISIGGLILLGNMQAFNLFSLFLNFFGVPVLMIIVEAAAGSYFYRHTVEGLRRSEH
jgi:hypothetical protein